MWKRVLVVFALFLAGYSTAAAQDQKPPAAAPPAEFKIPAEAAKQSNPVKPTPESLAKGKKIYGYDCAMCHGKDGDGKGDLASSLNAKMSDFRDSNSLKDRTDGELFYVIRNGKGEMPAEGDRAKGNDGWDLVNYVRSFAKKEAAEKNKD